MGRNPGWKALCAMAAMLAVSLAWGRTGQESRAAEWRAATDGELRSVIPARAPVIAERIETEMRSASGITDGHGKYVAGVVLITAGYSAEGKYSHFFLTQVPLRVGTTVRLAAGQYVIGYEHGEHGLLVRFYEAATGRLVGSVQAAMLTDARVEEFRIWPPGDRATIQIGRFGFSYQIGG